MLGAAVAALVPLLLPAGPVQALAVLLVATVLILSAWKLGRVGDAADAAGLGAALGVPFLAGSPWPLGLVIAGLAIFVTIAQRGRSPLALLAAATFFVGIRHAVQLDLLAGREAVPAAALFLALVAYGALLAAQAAHAAPRRAAGAAGAPWAGIALALVGLLLVLAAFPLLDVAGVTDAGVAALCLGTLIGALLAFGVWTRIRPLATTMGVVLPLSILAFALLALGPALAAIVLVCLGGALLWQAENVRAFLHA